MSNHITCPVCQGRLRKPDPQNDWFEFACWDCGLELPHEVVIGTEVLIETSRTQPDPAAFLKILCQLPTED